MEVLANEQLNSGLKNFAACVGMRDCDMSWSVSMEIGPDVRTTMQLSMAFGRVPGEEHRGECLTVVHTVRLYVKHGGKVLSRPAHVIVTPASMWLATWLKSGRDPVLDYWVKGYQSSCSTLHVQELE